MAVSSTFRAHTPYHQVLFRPNEADMIGTEWFSESTLNYAEHIFRHQASSQFQSPAPVTPFDPHASDTDGGRPALLFASERHPLTAVSWTQAGAAGSRYGGLAAASRA